jgi:hypothetical protein
MQSKEFCGLGGSEKLKINLKIFKHYITLLPVEKYFKIIMSKI